MKRKIHILGASGSGTTTLGHVLSETLPHSHFDTDDYFWETKYTKARPVSERNELLGHDLLEKEHWILSGSVCGWGDIYYETFDLLIFLWVSPEERLNRLYKRELERYGTDILPGGDMYEQSQAFMKWAAQYDTGGLEGRSKALHEEWMMKVNCPILRIEGDGTVASSAEMVMEYLNTNE